MGSDDPTTSLWVSAVSALNWVSGESCSVLYVCQYYRSDHMLSRNYIS